MICPPPLPLPVRVGRTHKLSTRLCKTLNQAARFFGRESEDGTIDSNEFVRILAWHDLHTDIGQQLKALMPHREVSVSVGSQAKGQPTTYLPSKWDLRTQSYL